MEGRVHSFQSLGTLDGPGVRFVVFLQGCPLRCGCCHNPDTWDLHGGMVCTAEDVVGRALRCRSYFGEDGGVTLSGGEPLLQADFAAEIFRLCKAEGVHTCLDTSGCVPAEQVSALLEVTDRVLLDVKYVTKEQYRAHVGCSLEAPLRFLAHLNARNTPVTLRQVTIPTLNDTDEAVLALRRIAEMHPCVDGIELLPFRKICQSKYDLLHISFPLGHLPTPDKATMEHLRGLLGPYGG